jgi:hypothetical protein
VLIANGFSFLEHAFRLWERFMAQKIDMLGSIAVRFWDE